VWPRVQGWLNHAEEDAYIARGCLHFERPSLGGAAYHCQQAAEKLLKGFLVCGGIDFGRTHDLDRLGNTVKNRFPVVTPLVEAVADWTSWGVSYRYPGEDVEPDPTPTMEEFFQALDLIERLAESLRALAP
jgi:HEPN domain-containing protein